jgi:hypothetical protein
MMSSFADSFYPDFVVCALNSPVKVAYCNLFENPVSLVQAPVYEQMYIDLEVYQKN